MAKLRETALEKFIRERYEELLLAFGYWATYLPTDGGRVEIRQTFKNTVERAIRREGTGIWTQKGHADYVRAKTRRIAMLASKRAKASNRTSINALHVRGAAKDVINEVELLLERFNRSKKKGKTLKDRILLLKVFCE